MKRAFVDRVLVVDLGIWVLGFARAARQRSRRRRQGAIIVGVRTGPNNLDPRFFGTDETSQRVDQLIFNSLMDIGDDLSREADAGERLDNPDPLTYIAVLRHGVKFHDGHEFTAKDVVYTYGQYLDPAFLSPYKGAFRMLKSVEAIDDYTVKFTLKEPFGAFPIQLVSPPIVPAGTGPDFGAHPIGTGPYRFVRYDVDDQVILAPFADYFEGAPKNAGIVIRVVPDDTMRGLELRKGSVDLVVNDVNPTSRTSLAKEGATGSRPRRAGLLVSGDRTCAIQSCRISACATRSATRSIAARSYVFPPRALARLATGLIPSQAWAYEPDIFSVHPRSRARETAPRRSRLQGSRRRRSAAPPAPLVQGGKRRGISPAGDRDPAAASQRRHRGGRPFMRVRHDASRT